MKRLIVGILVCMLLLPVGVQVAWAGPSASNPVIHIVQWGENLTSIARRYGTTVQALVLANGIRNQNRIYAGQRLVISGAATPLPASGCTYAVRIGDTLSGIASRFGISVSALMQANGMVNPHLVFAGQRLAIPCAALPSTTPPTPVPGGVNYIVQRGDTLAKIAMHFGVTIWSIVQANNISNPNIIFVGQKLFIPQNGSAPPRTS